MKGSGRVRWRLAASCLAVAGFLAGCDLAGSQGGNEGGAAGSGGVGQAGWSKHEVVDRNGFDRPMTAITVDVPPGWQATSQIRWDGVNGQCSMGGASANVRMTSPDGRQQIDYIPGFLVANYPDVFTAKGAAPGDFCVLGSVTSGEQLVREIAVPRLRPGWRIESIAQAEPPPELEKMVQAGAGSGANVQGYAVAATLVAPDGAQIEYFYMAGIVMQMPQLVQGIASPVQNQNMRSWSVRGPREAIPELIRMSEQIRAGMQIDPEWGERMNRHSGEMQRRSVPPPRRNAPVAGGGESPDLTDTDGWLRRGRDESRRQRERVDRIYERTLCVDPETGERFYVDDTATCPTR